MQDLDSSFDSIDLELYHNYNEQVHSIMKYLREINLKFCTDPTQKQDEYYSKLKEEALEQKEINIQRNKFQIRTQKKSLDSLHLTIVD